MDTVVFRLLLNKNNKRKRDTSSDSSSDDEAMFRKFEKQQHKKIKKYVKDVVLHYTPSDFQKHFRLSKTTFEELLATIQVEYGISTRRPQYPILDSLLLTIWGLATQEGFREIGSRFNVSEGHAYRIFMIYCCRLTKFHTKYIVWPKGQQAREQVLEFNAIRGENSFPNVFGCIDERT
ncbi:hypothetical protein FQR65_LT19096 [Abscondita terminalis]|nr:hypothetical protein FQR65_LT19096 [Abscondita terminalis]